MKKIFTVMAVLALLTGCSQSAKETDKLEIVTTFYPIYDFTNNVVGDNATVKMVMPLGIDAHDFEPSPQDVAAIHDADVFIYHGAGMESWVDSILSTINTEKITVIELSSVVDLLENSNNDHDDHEHADHDHDGHDDHEHADHDHEGHNHGAFDPHTWLSPKNAIKEVSLIRDTLIEIDPDHKDNYISNATRYLEQLNVIDSDFESLKTSKHHKDFLVDHQAYGYLARDYDLHQQGLMASMLKEEPTARELEDILDSIQENDIQAFFVNPTNSMKLIDVIKKETNIKVLPLHTIESLTKDQIDNGDNYLKLMNENYQSLKEGLIRE